MTARTPGAGDRLPRPGEQPGSAPPQRRLAVTPIRPALPALRPRLSFPLGAPTRPATLPAAPPERRLGVDYDTDWARRYPARLARAALTEAVTRPAVAAIARPQVHGTDRIAHLRGPVLFAANHVSHVDTPLLLSVVPEPWRHRLVVAGAADYFFDRRAKAAAFALLLNAVPVERRRVDRTSANRLASLMSEGWSLLIFPEGGRSPDGWAQRHTRGAAWLAERTGRPVVPVHVSGTGAILPRHSTRLRPGRTRVDFGKPLQPSGDARSLSERLEQAVAALADEAETDWWSAARRAAAGRTPPRTGPGAVAAWRRTWALGPSQPSDRAGRWPR